MGASFTELVRGSRFRSGLDLLADITFQFFGLLGKVGPTSDDLWCADPPRLWRLVPWRGRCAWPGGSCCRAPLWATLMQSSQLPFSHGLLLCPYPTTERGRLTQQMNAAWLKPAPPVWNLLIGGDGPARKRSPPRPAQQVFCLVPSCEGLDQPGLFQESHWCSSCRHSAGGRAAT